MSDSEFKERLTESIPSLRLYAYRFTTDGDEIDELMQETLLKALVGRDYFRKDENLRGWLSVIMRNTFLNMIKVKSPCFLGYEICSNRGYRDCSFDCREIEKVIASLPSEFYIPFNLFVSGFSYKEIADELRVPLGTVKTRIHFARKTLREYMER